MVREEMLSRRLFLFGGGAVLGGALGLLVRRNSTAEADLLRPPGARAPDDFLAACIRCGQCVEACPYDTLRLATDLLGPSRGTPFLDARHVPCYLCRDHDRLKCIEACPTSALEPLADLSEIAMGTAVIDENTCLAYNSVICRTCWHVCPYPNEAIRFDSMLRPVVEEQTCIGCGLCQHACPTEPGSIPIRPRQAEEASS